MGLRVDYPCGCIRAGDQMRLCAEHQRQAIVAEAQPSRPTRLVIFLVVLIVTLGALALIGRA